MTAKYDDHDGRLRGKAGVQRRLRVWSKNPNCAVCGRLTDYPNGFHLDHRVPLYKGGEDKDSNLQVLCIYPCHEDKTRMDLGQTERVAVGHDGWPIPGGRG